jgi:hypothetical protein
MCGTYPHPHAPAALRWVPAVLTTPRTCQRGLWAWLTCGVWLACSTVDDLREQIGALEADGVFSREGGAAEGAPARLKDMSIPLCVEVLPAEVRKKQLFKSFLTGYAGAWDSAVFLRLLAFTRCGSHNWPSETS